MSPASVTVVVPTYNSGRWIADAIDSALAQTRVPQQIVVIDDGSTDDTWARLRRYGSAIDYVPQANSGVSAARNRGLELARGEFVAFLDADDFWHARKLEIQMSVFDRRPELAAIGTLAFNWPLPSPPDVDGAMVPELDLVTWADLAVKNRLITSSVVARRRVLLDVGGFDTQLQGPEDRDLWLRVADVSSLANVRCALT